MCHSDPPVGGEESSINSRDVSLRSTRQGKMLSNLNIGAKKQLYWTAHAKGKMMQYRLSEGRVKRVLHSPERVETGIAPKTVAAMQTQKGPKNSHEIWVMAADEKSRRKIISAWRYPGKTKPGESLPEDILKEFRSGISVLRQAPQLEI